MANSAPSQPTFTMGSIMRHVVVMTATGSVGLMAIFLVDVVNLLYIAMLGSADATAAMGYAGLMLFITTSIGIGFTIAVTALTARAIGSGDRARARRIAASGLVLTGLALSVVTLVLYPLIPQAISLMGAEGPSHDIAVGYLWIAMAGSPALGVGMAMTGVLRADGDARRSMYVTLGGAVATAIFDPIFIFGLDLGVTGAAIVTLLSRVVMIAIGWHGTQRVHHMLTRPSVADILQDVRPLNAIAMPAVLTNLATPVANIIVTATVARFSTEAVAAWAIIGRLYPMVFGAIFALSGSVGAILGQNIGARRFDRVRRTLSDSLIFIALYVALVWLLVALGADAIVWAFHAEGEAAEIVRFFAYWMAPTFVFTGALFVANASFNNLGHAAYSTLFNWGRSTIGTVPFCWLGLWWGSPEAVLMLWGLGAAAFGLPAVVVAFRSIDQLAARSEAPAAQG